MQGFRTYCAHAGMLLLHSGIVRGIGTKEFDNISAGCKAADAAPSANVKSVIKSNVNGVNLTVDHKAL